MTGRVFRYAPAVGFMVALWIVSDQPGDRLFPVQSGDKVAHALAYAVLAGALRWGAGPGSGRTASLAAWMVAAAYGMLDEWHQSWVPGRFATVGDWVADAIGAAFGVVATARWMRARERRR